MDILNVFKQILSKCNITKIHGKNIDDLTLSDYHNFISIKNYDNIELYNCFYTHGNELIIDNSQFIYNVISENKDIKLIYDNGNNFYIDNYINFIINNCKNYSEGLSGIVYYHKNLAIKLPFFIHDDDDDKDIDDINIKIHKESENSIINDAIVGSILRTLSLNTFVKTYGLFFYKNFPVVIMEKINGFNLDEFIDIISESLNIKDEKNSAILLCENILKQLLTDLSVAYNNLGYIHKDLHSKNIIITRDFKPIVIDLGSGWCYKFNSSYYLDDYINFINRQLFSLYKLLTIEIVNDHKHSLVLKLFSDESILNTTDNSKYLINELLDIINQI